MFSFSWKRPKIINSRATLISREREEGHDGGRRQVSLEAGNQMATGNAPGCSSLGRHRTFAVPRHRRSRLHPKSDEMPCVKMTLRREDGAMSRAFEKFRGVRFRVGPPRTCRPNHRWLDILVTERVSRAISRVNDIRLAKELRRRGVPFHNLFSYTRKCSRPKKYFS